MGGAGLKPAQFWALHPIEFWWLYDTLKIDPVYQGKKHSITGSQVEGIVADLKAMGIESKWPKK